MLLGTLNWASVRMFVSATDEITMVVLHYSLNWYVLENFKRGKSVSVFVSVTDATMTVLH